MTTFDDHYRSIFGERWNDLRSAIEGGAERVALMNPYVDDAGDRLPEEAPSDPGLEGCRRVPPETTVPEPRDESPRPYYLMDPASVWAARALQVESEDRVLDLCAAPGGKTLAIAFQLGASGMLVANDRSAKRLDRLEEVVDGYLPEDVRRHLATQCRDGSKWGTRQTDAFDRVLVDAPCSGERHLLGDEAAMAEWTPARAEHLAQRQFALLCAAVDVARPGGRVVYSTCALDPRENDGVVERLLERRDGVDSASPQLSVGETTRFGRHVLPDRVRGGPMYVAALRIG